MFIKSKMETLPGWPLSLYSSSTHQPFRSRWPSVQFTTWMLSPVRTRAMSHFRRERDREMNTERGTMWTWQLAPGHLHTALASLCFVWTSFYIQHKTVVSGFSHWGSIPKYLCVSVPYSFLVAVEHSIMYIDCIFEQKNFFTFIYLLGVRHAGQSLYIETGR